MDLWQVPEPTFTEHDDVPPDENHDVWQWRAQQLHRLGLSSLLSHAFAAVVDWHEFARLVERGCPPELALEIVR